jgi:DNA-binding response OmpR family regulator
MTRPAPRIVYVEDDDDIREMMDSFLSGEGYVTESYRTAEDGLEALERNGCELLLTDYILPGEDAAWLLREARARGLLENVPVVVVSGEYKPHGINGAKFLRKPVVAEVLLATIEEALQSRRASSNGVAKPLASRTSVADEQIELVLYIASPSHESDAARRNLDRIVRAVGSENVRIVIHDITDRNDAALAAIEEDRIVVVPTLVKRGPGPKTWIAGDLSKRERVTELIATALAASRLA